jgi:hypothetical protein
VSILDADTGGNIVSLTRANCAQLFFVYAGGLGQVEGMNQMTFLQRSGLLRRNVTFVRDPEVQFFDKGVSPDIPNLEAVLDWHEAYVKSLPHVTEVYCLGNSFGGWSAMFFGYMLAAKKVFSLAPSGVWGQKMLRELMMDHNGVTEYDIYYSPDHEKDKAFAEFFDGCPGTTLQARNHGHLMLRGLLNSGEMQEMLPPFIEAAAVA